MACEIGLSMKDLMDAHRAQESRLKAQWWEEVQKTEREIVQEFLDAALAHFEAEVRELRDLAKEDPERFKAKFEGARWTAFHTRTLSKYLNETYRKEG